ncbi:hypothetical protein ACTHQT_26025 [Cytobacillus praedii]
MQHLLHKPSEIVSRTMWVVTWRKLVKPLSEIISGSLLTLVAGYVLIIAF